MKKSLLFFCFIAFIISGFAQDISYARRMLDTLCSPAMQGRGYVSDGDKKAANFIAGEFKKNKLLSFGENYFQQFPIAVNTFPEKIIFKIDKTLLQPGVDYMLVSNSVSTKGTYEVVWLTKSVLDSSAALVEFARSNIRDKVIIVDGKDVVDKGALETLRLFNYVNLYRVKGVIFIEDNKLTWNINGSYQSSGYFVVRVLRSSLPKNINKVHIQFKNIFNDKYTSQNVIGYIRGTQQPDTFMVFSAHYDHLGRMGADTYFPGANDNASGVSMMLDLMNYFSLPAHRPKYSIAFMAFSAEELGLQGSKYYCEHPFFPLNKIKFLINLDLVGTGDDGIMVVNGSVYQRAFEKLEAINQKKEYVKKIDKRGEAANSDHYFFYKNNVPSFFIYTIGGNTEYHNINDRPETLPLTDYEDVFRLIKDFTEGL